MNAGPNLVHNPHSADVFADSAVGFFTFNGCMRITFESVRSNYTATPPTLDNVVIGRLVMPVPAAKAMAESILSQIQQMQAEPQPPSVSVQ